MAIRTTFDVPPSDVAGQGGQLSRRIKRTIGGMYFRFFKMTPERHGGGYKLGRDPKYIIRSVWQKALSEWVIRTWPNPPPALNDPFELPSFETMDDPFSELP